MVKVWFIGAYLFWINNSCYILLVLPSLAARVLWRMHKSTGVATDSQLISVEQLEDHVADMLQEDLKQLETDVQTFMKYWSYGRKQHSVEFISHIFGIVCALSSSKSTFTLH